MSFFEKDCNVFIRISAFIMVMVFATIPFFFIKNTISDPSWSPGFFGWFDQLEKLILDSIAEYDSTFENVPLLWKRDASSYAITFTCGVSRQKLYDLADDIWCFCSCSVQAWCPPDLFKKHIGDWLYLCYGAKDLLVAISEDETQWNINPDDPVLHHSKEHDRFFQVCPKLDWSRMEIMMI